MASTLSTSSSDGGSNKPQATASAGGFHLYKPGQGYWTRLVSGLGSGVLICLGAWWLWEQLAGLPGGIYTQAVGSVVPLVVLGLLVFWWVGIKPKTVDFLIATEAEMKKVNWPTRREVIGSTGIVIFFLIAIVGILLLADILFSIFFYEIGVLKIKLWG